MKKQKKLQVGIIGADGKEDYEKGGGPSENNLEMAEEMGQLLAQTNITVVTGGKGGIMEAAAKGAKKYDGTTVGVIKGGKRFESNDFTEIEVLSGADNNGLDEYLLVSMCDALIVFGGGAGTLQEIVIAYRNNKPIIVVNNTGGWSDKLVQEYLDERQRTSLLRVDNPKQALEELNKLFN